MDLRWLTLGPIVADVLQQIHVTSRLGMYQMDPDICDFVTKVGASMFVADAAMASMLEDDRVPRQWHELMRDIDEELAYIEEVPVEIWNVLALVAPTRAS